MTRRRQALLLAAAGGLALASWGGAFLSPGRATAQTARPGAAFTTPLPGSAERKAILDALRAPVQKTLKQRPVVFKVDHLRVRGEWAFLSAVPEQPNGKAMNYRGTVYQQAIREGAFDNWVCALLRRERRAGGRQRWRVVTYVLGATDVAWDGWDRRYHAPRAVFPYAGKG
jgi:hypothetical protein